jgi:TRAP-type uncharacterized transport system substrate-binding protein
VAARKGVFLEVKGTKGSEEALEKVDSGAIDLALVQGGLDPQGRGREQVFQVAAMRIEPLHLLVKQEFAASAGEALGLEFLRGRTVNLSEPGSGTFDLARDVLAFAGLRPPSGPDPGDYNAATLGYRRLIDEPDRAKLPDAVFTVSALPSPVVKHLVAKQGYVIMPLRFGEAFTLDSMHVNHARPAAPFDAKPTPDTNAKAAPRADPEAAVGTSVVQRGHVYNIEIPAYTYGIAPPIPPQPVPTFGTRLLLVANRGVSEAAVARLLEAAYANAPGGPALDPSLLEVPPELEWHPGTLAYRERTKPVSLGDEVDFFEKSASLAGLLASALFFLWRWTRFRVRRRQELGFESYMLKVTAVEQEALQLELAAELDLGKLLRMQFELNRLKSEALKRFAEGEIEGEVLISGFMTHVNDAREYLTRLILHERDRIEEEAVRQRRPAEVLWFEAVGDLARNGPNPATRNDNGAESPDCEPIEEPRPQAEPV